MPIRVLAPDTAAKIAAGEVVGRPADVVRELVDNAIDAGATQVAVEVRGGGLSLIRVSDNGYGIPAGEVALAFERHATSKIAAADDLFRIDTLGFRGEALPSIAAVAEVTLITKGAGEPVGSYITLGAGKPVEQGRRASAQGTTVNVRDLFQTVPARLKFVRAPATENGQISHVVSQFALAYPQIRFSLVSDGRTAFQSTGNGRLHDAIVKVYGADVAAAMLPLTLDQSPALLVEGFVSEPKITRATRNYLSFFVNHRCVQSRVLAHAVEEAYHALLPVGRHPVAVMNLVVPAESIDVNIHPSKAEVRFLNDRDLHTHVQRAVRQALTDRLTVPAMVSRPTVPLAGVQQRLEAVGTVPLSAPPKPAAPGESFPEDSSGEGSPQPAGSIPVLRVLGQVGAMFIIAEGPNGVFLIDQHRAHERVLYERLGKERASAAVTTQHLLSPMPIELTARQAALLASRVEDLAALGFDLAPFGEHTYLLRAVPATLRQADLGEAMREIVDQAIEDRSNGDWQDRLMTTMACKGAIKSGQMLTMQEMRELVLQLEATSLPPMCPHGGPVMVHLSQAQLERHFGRR